MAARSGVMTLLLRSPSRRFNPVSPLQFLEDLMKYALYSFLALVATLVILNNTGLLRALVGLAS